MIFVQLFFAQKSILAENIYSGPKDQMETRRPSEKIGDQRPSQKTRIVKSGLVKDQLATLSPTAT